MKATLIKSNLPNFAGSANLYKLNEKVDYAAGNTEYIVASAINNKWVREVLLFPANSDGKVLDWLELEGQRETQNIDRVVFNFVSTQ